MAAEYDPRLMSLLQAVLGFSDSMRDLGAVGDVTVQLSREDGLMMLKLVAGANDPEAETMSQLNRPQGHGVNSLAVAGITFEWPKADAARRRPQASRMFSSSPRVVGTAANQNDPGEAARRFYGFEEDAPALR